MTDNTEKRERALWWHGAWTRKADEHAREAAEWLLHEPSGEFHEEEDADVEEAAAWMQAEAAAQRFREFNTRAEEAWARAFGDHVPPDPDPVDEILELRERCAAFKRQEVDFKCQLEAVVRRYPGHMDLSTPTLIVTWIDLMLGALDGYEAMIDLLPGDRTLSRRCKVDWVIGELNRLEAENVALRARLELGI